MNKYLALAKESAKSHTFDTVLAARLCAVIVRGGNVLSVGFNSTAVNSFVIRMAEKYGPSNKPCNTHAEMDAIQQVRYKVDLTGAKMYVARIRCHEEYALRRSNPSMRELLAMARPCVICESMCREYGIKRTYYTIDDEHFGVMRFGATTTDRIERLV